MFGLVILFNILTAYIITLIVTSTSEWEQALLLVCVLYISLDFFILQPLATAVLVFIIPDTIHELIIKAKSYICDVVAQIILENKWDAKTTQCDETSTIKNDLNIEFVTNYSNLCHNVYVSAKISQGIPNLFESKIISMYRSMWRIPPNLHSYNTGLLSRSII